MKTVKFSITGITPVSFSAPMLEQKTSKEDWATFEKRTWSQKMHVDAAGNVFIPPLAMKKAIEGGCNYMGEKVPGRGNKTFFGFIMAGTAVFDPLVIQHEVNGRYVPVKATDVEPEWVYTGDPNGKNTRVWKAFPIIPAGWKAEGELHLLDPMLASHADRLRSYIEAGGKYVGLLRWRPKNGGLYGRYAVDSFEIVGE